MAKLPVEFHPDARGDVLEAFDWYAERSAIQEFPDLWAGYLFGTRRYLMKRFPVVIVYRVQTSRIEFKSRLVGCPREENDGR